MISAGKQYQNYEYYAKDPVYSVEQGQSIGGLARELGFNEMNGDTMAKLQAGQNLHGEQVIERAGQGGQEHNPGKDFTFSIDKGISILRNSAETPDEIKQAIDKGMLAAAGKIVETAVNNGMITYRLHEGDTIKHESIANKENIAAYAFLHSTSRENDPQTHVHIAIMNMAKVGDEYKAIKFDGMLQKGGRDMLDAVGKNEFYRTVEKELGKDLSDIITKNKVTGELSVKGIDKRIEEQYSTRHEQIKAVFNDLRDKYPNATEGELKQIANNQTREKKDLSFTKEQLEDKLKPANEAVGAAIATIGRAQGLGLNEKGVPETRLKEDVKMVADALGQKEIFTDVNTLYKEVLKQDARYTFEAVKEAVKRDNTLQLKETRNGEGFLKVEIATKENIAAEKEVQAFFENGKGKGFGINKDIVNKGIEAAENKQGFKFAGDQKASIELALSGKGKGGNIIGVAGAGKTTMFAAINTIAKENGIQVIGFSNNGSQAETLMRETGIKSQTIKSFTEMAARDENIVKSDKHTLVVVDESSMQGIMDTKDLLNSLEKKYADYKVVFVGDKHQIASISAGRVFENAANSSADKTVLENIYRQKDERLKENIYGFYNELNAAKEKGVSEINGASIVDKLNGGGYIKIAEAGKEKEVAVNEYLKAAKSGEKDIAVIVRTNAAKDAIDNSVREGLKTMGMLKGRERELGVFKKDNSLGDVDKFRAEAYKKGDIIAFRANEFKEVVGVDAKNNTISLKHIAFVAEKDAVVKDNKINWLNGNKTTVKLDVIDRKNGQIAYYAGQTFKLDLSKADKVERVQRYIKRDLKLKTGEKVMFTANVKLDSATEKIKTGYTYSKKTLGEQNELFTNRKIMSMKALEAYVSERKKVDVVGALREDKKIAAAVKEAKEKGYKYKEYEIKNSWGVVQSRGVVVDKPKEGSVNVVNGLRAEYMGQKGQVHSFAIKDKDGKDKILKLDENNKKDAAALRSLEHAYAITSEKAQGLGVKNVITVENEKKNANQNLVDISRTINKLTVVTTQDKIERADGKQSALDKAFSKVQDKTTSIEQDYKKDVAAKNTATLRSQDYERSIGF